MKIILMLLSSSAMIFLSAHAFAEGNVKRGKILFNDPKLSGSSFGVSCNTCHPKGRGLENSGAADKTSWSSCTGEQTSLEGSINICIQSANKGRPLDLKSQDMKDLIAYIRSLADKTKKKK